ncbi:MAG: hypothetical protein AAF466_08845 [Bacteroidota bacterium]
MLRGLGLLVMLMLAVTSCKEEDDFCSSVDLRCECVYMGLVDEAGNSLLQDGGPYDPEAIRLFRDDQEIELFAEVDDQLTTLLFYYRDMISGVVYSLQLSETETDRIRITTTLIDGRCGDYLELTEFRYNGELVEGQGETYIIEKRS